MRKNRGINLCDLGQAVISYDMTPKAHVTKGKIEKLNFIKIKDFYASKDPMKKVKS